MTFERDELIAWQKRAWEYGKRNPWLEFEQCVFETRERPPEMLQLEVA